MEDDKRVNYKLDAINKLINNLKLSISGNKEHDEFENQHKSESDETQTLLTEKFDLIHSDLATI